MPKINQLQRRASWPQRCLCLGIRDVGARDLGLVVYGRGFGSYGFRDLGLVVQGFGVLGLRSLGFSRGFKGLSFRDSGLRVQGF